MFYLAGVLCFVNISEGQRRLILTVILHCDCLFTSDTEDTKQGIYKMQTVHYSEDLGAIITDITSVHNHTYEDPQRRFLF